MFNEKLRLGTNKEQLITYFLGAIVYYKAQSPSYLNTKR